MLAKLEERKKAILLRGKGYSYSEIMKIIPVSQASLSFWLKDIVLDSKYVEKLKLKKLEGQKKGALMRKKNRLKLESLINGKAAKEINHISDRELWLLGIIAYWCEGAKQKIYNVSHPVIFSNSDPILIKLFLKWLTNICKVEEENIIFTIYIHETGDIGNALEYWSKIVNISSKKFGKTILKKHNIKTVRHNTGSNYYGLLRIAVRKSTNFNRQIAGWMHGINNVI